MFRQPSQTSVKTRFDGDMMTPVAGIRIRKKKNIFFQHIILSFYTNQTSHTNRFLQSFSGRRMFRPDFSQILGYGHSTATSPVIPHIQHQYSRLYFRYLSLCCIRPGMIMQFPGFATIFTIHNSGIRNTVCPNVLHCKYQSSVLHSNSPSRTLQQKKP